MYKIGVVGDKDSVLGFLALGIDVFAAESSDEIRRTLVRLSEDDYAIIYITEKAYMLAKDIVERYKNNILPAIIVIPGVGEKYGVGMNEIKESAKKAIGVDLLFNE